MAEVKSLFREYLSAIEPDNKATKLAAKSHIKPREYLEADDDFSEHVSDSFLYGSYRRNTAIHDIKDVDIIILTDFDPNKDEPSTVLSQLKAALKRHYGSSNVLETNRRSVQVLNPLPEEDSDLTLDIIPAVDTGRSDGYLHVPDRELKSWVLTNPQGHIDAVSQRNTECDKKLVPMVKILKAWWANQTDTINEPSKRPRPKGFWIETLVLTHFDPKEDSWAARFVALLEKLVAEYPKGSGAPSLEDPGMPGTTFQTSMSQEEYEDFISKIRASLELAHVAIADEDRSSSSKTWAEIFGDAFPIEETNTSKVLSGKEFTLGDASHAKNLSFPVSITNKATLGGELYKRFGRKNIRFRAVSSNATVREGCRIRFQTWTDAKRPYEVYWRVVNTGGHARQVGGLRGEPFLDSTGPDLVRWEPTEYTGKHWMECFIVKNGEVVAATDRFYLNVDNPNFQPS